VSHASPNRTPEGSRPSIWSPVPVFSVTSHAVFKQWLDYTSACYLPATDQVAAAPASRRAVRRRPAPSGHSSGAGPLQQSFRRHSRETPGERLAGQPMRWGADLNRDHKPGWQASEPSRVETRCSLRRVQLRRPHRVVNEDSAV
jgi:hypothetical protein